MKKLFFCCFIFCALINVSSIHGAKHKNSYTQTEAFFVSHERPVVVFHKNKKQNGLTLCFSKNLAQAFPEWKEVQKRFLCTTLTYPKQVLDCYAKLLELKYHGRKLLMELETPSDENDMLILDSLISKLQKTSKKIIQDSIKTPIDTFSLIRLINVTNATVICEDVTPLFNAFDMKDPLLLAKLKTWLYLYRFYSFSNDIKSGIKKNVKEKQAKKVFDIMAEQPKPLKDLAEQNIFNLQESCLDLSYKKVGIRVNDIELLPSLLVKKHGQEILKKIKGINLSNQFLRETSVLEGFKNIKYLFLSTTLIREIDSIAKLKKLEHLNLGITLVKDLTPLENLQNLKKLNIAYIYASKLDALKNLPALEELDISDNQVLKIAHLLPHLTQLKTLSIYSLKNVYPATRIGDFVAKTPPSQCSKNVLYVTHYEKDVIPQFTSSRVPAHTPTQTQKNKRTRKKRKKRKKTSQSAPALEGITFLQQQQQRMHSPQASLYRRLHPGVPGYAPQTQQQKPSFLQSRVIPAYTHPLLVTTKERRKQSNNFEPKKPRKNFFPSRQRQTNKPQQKNQVSNDISQARFLKQQYKEKQERKYSRRRRMPPPISRSPKSQNKAPKRAPSCPPPPRPSLQQNLSEFSKEFISAQSSHFKKQKNLEQKKTLDRKRYEQMIQKKVKIIEDRKKDQNKPKNKDEKTEKTTVIVIDD